MPRIGKQKNVGELAWKLSVRTHFTSDECKSLLLMYHAIAKVGKLDRQKFREILHAAFNITDDVMLDRVFRVFDKDNDGLIGEDEWVEGLSIMCRGVPKEMTDFCYDVYDINGDKSLAREELHTCLKSSIIPYHGVINGDELDEGIREIVEIGMKKLDVDKDGQVTPLDFKNACLEDPLLLQSIGPCLPSVKALACFLSLFTEKYRNISSEYNEKWREAQRAYFREKDGEHERDSLTRRHTFTGHHGSMSKPSPLQPSGGNHKSISSNKKPKFT